MKYVLKGFKHLNLIRKFVDTAQALGRDTVLQQHTT
jgi:hypothetical protein